MQEIINAMLKAILLDANQQKPITYSVRRWNDLFIEFHSWYIFEFKEWMIDITNVETWKKERIRDWVNAKLSNEVLKMLKDWLNKDFNSWIKIEDEPRGDEGNIWDTEADDSNDKSDNEWEEDTANKDDNTSEATIWLDEEKKTSQRKIPEWSKVQKKK